MVAMFLCAVAVCLADERPDGAAPVDAKKLVGRWEAKGDPEKRTIVFEFAEDGGLVVRITRRGEESKAAGKYRIEKEKLTLTLKIAGVEDERVVTVTRFTDEQLVGTGEKGRPLILVRQLDR